jgi:hypothetical protein
MEKKQRLVQRPVKTLPRVEKLRLTSRSGKSMGPSCTTRVERVLSRASGATSNDVVDVRTFGIVLRALQDFLHPGANIASSACEKKDGPTHKKACGKMDFDPESIAPEPVAPDQFIGCPRADPTFIRTPALWRQIWYLNKPDFGLSCTSTFIL